MPNPRRDSSARADNRPAFNRPPGVRATPPADDGPRPPKRTSREKAKQSPAPSPEKYVRVPGGKRKSSSPVKASPLRGRDKYGSGTSSATSSNTLSIDSLARLDAYNEKISAEDRTAERKKKEKQYKNLRGAQPAQHRRKRAKNRNVSGAILEEGRYNEKQGRPRRGGYEREVIRARNDGGGGSNRKPWILLGVIVLLLIIFIPVGVVLSNKSKATSSSSSADTGSTPSNTCEGSDVPASAKGTYTDITTWLDTTDFNCTYTSETVGGLSVMGLYSTWDDSTRANGNVPPLNEEWVYGQRPIRGVNLGGWLDLEPFITPSMFNYPAVDNIVDEWTLMEKLGPSATRIMENHYSTFVTKQTFVEIADAGLDHVRIPYPYWAVTTYPGDPYVAQVSWRYLLRAIEWARESGLRINLDLHSLPGSQNGWGHSGHQGPIGWLNGTDGTLNGQRSLDIHNQLSQFFAQDRYKNVITIYGLCNEPKMIMLDTQTVLEWNTQAIQIIRNNGMKQYLTFGDGFLALSDWDSLFKGVDSKLVMDTHQYQIFNVRELVLTHQAKINLVCNGWTSLMSTANNPSTGWGPTVDGEWSQADTDCATNLNNVGVGSRWAGTLNTGNPETSVLTSTCPDPPCSCAAADADPSSYSSDYKQFLQMYAEAQMYSFEQAWGWFYWTWETESAVQWSWKLGLAAGILPQKAYSPSFRCGDTVPSFSALSEQYK